MNNIPSGLPSGRGTFAIKRVFFDDKEGLPLKTKAGDPKALVIVEVEDSKGRKGTVYEHIADATNFDWKRTPMFEACQKGHLRVAGSNANLDKLEGLSGECLIDIDEYQGTSKCVIKKYYTKVKIKDDVEVDFNTLDFEDEIPF